MLKNEIANEAYITLRKAKNVSSVTKLFVFGSMLDWIYILNLIVREINVFQDDLYLAGLIVLAIAPAVISFIWYKSLSKELSNEMCCTCMYCGKNKKLLFKPDGLKEYFEWPVCADCANELEERVEEFKLTEEVD